MLGAGEVGYIICNIKSLNIVHIGDKVAHVSDEKATPLRAIRLPNAWFYCGLFPSDGQDFEELARCVGSPGDQ